MRRTLIVYHCFPHYRTAVLRRLVQGTPERAGVPVSGDVADVDIELIDAKVLDAPLCDGGLGRLPVRNTWFGRLVLWQRGLMRILTREDYDSVIFLGVMYYLSTWLGAVLARSRGKRVLFWTHGYLREERSLQGWLRSVFYRLAHGHLLYGERAKKLMMQRGFSADDLYVVYNSLDVPAQTELRELLPSKDELQREVFGDANTPVFGFVGRLTQRKRLDMLVDAAARVIQRGHRVRLLIVGDGPERAALEQRARDAEVPARFTGACHDEPTLARYISSMQACVSPGEVGLVAMHAMAYGVPVVTHDEPDEHGPEYEAIIPGSTGARYSHGDVESLAATLMNVLRWPAEDTEVACREVIHSRYNPSVQERVIWAAVEGVPAGEVAKWVGSERR